MITHDVEVLVVGLGPVGATTALYLARHGITVAGIEALPAPASDLRASTVHAPTIEMLDALGAANVVLNYGLRAPEYQFRDRQSGETFSFDMSELADRTRFPFRVQCEQHKLAEDVVDQLGGEASVQLRYGQRLIWLGEHDGGVSAYVETSRDVECYRARYVIGADGAGSLVRKLMALGFDGFTYGEKYLCLSTQYPIEEAFDGLCHVNYVSDPDEWLVLLRVPSVWRVMLPVREDEDDQTLLSDTRKDAVFRRILGHDAPVTTHHRTIYRLHQRVADRFVAGRVALVGDAAHLNSPMGGFGMNSGIHDGINLGQKLVAILREGGDARLVELFDRQRRQMTHDFIQAQSIANMAMMRSGWGAARDQRREKMADLSKDREARRAFLLSQAMFTSLEQAAAIQ
ncbi:FAD-dependent oxidoreductase [Sphingomonas immobilis]|uniref:NAD(P)/FAD-dependent oxidoreductase n=1 Tax=Sphingomonas immobilis TaxID=3063997 RepID=A0ABT9A0P2_9SPHN|nr:NAD(P)/FAD-dependent oxidoreductase [Sphingomonas sp. CA1-15]MDO7843403.1 NAD(P)/FAD-dependent oxidoreductase [Sphingomonas sp. CA1-15]